MAKFHILQVQDDVGTFKEVEGEAVEIGGIQAFARNAQGEGPFEYWIVSDVMAGIRISGPYGTKEEAITMAEVLLLKCGVDRFREMQQEMIDKYGRSPSAPEPEPEDIIQAVIKRGDWDMNISILMDDIGIIRHPHPPDPGEIETCLCL